MNVEFEKDGAGCRLPEAVRVPVTKPIIFKGIIIIFKGIIIIFTLSNAPGSQPSVAMMYI